MATGPLRIVSVRVHRDGTARVVLSGGQKLYAAWVLHGGRRRALSKVFRRRSDAVRYGKRVWERYRRLALEREEGDGGKDG